MRAAIKTALVAEDWRFLEVNATDFETQRPLLEELCETFGLAADPRLRLDIESFLERRELWRRILFVDLREVGAEDLRRWSEFLAQHSAASRERLPTQRLVICAMCGASATDVMPDEDLVLRRHWWWGALSRLDAEVFVADLVYGTAVDPVIAASIVEVATFDLALAQKLVDQWQGNVAELLPLLDEYAHRHDSLGSAERVAVPRSDRQPPRQVLEMWSRGAVNRWSEIDPCLHSAAAGVRGGREITSRVWRAQVRTLLPEIELERQRLAEWALRNRRALTDTWARADVAGLEIGPLYKLISETTALRAQHEQWELARWLRNARNLLAHWDVVDARQLREGRRLAGRARTAERFA